MNSLYQKILAKVKLLFVEEEKPMQMFPEKQEINIPVKDNLPISEMPDNFFVSKTGWFFSEESHRWVNLNHFSQIIHEPSHQNGFTVFGIYPEGSRFFLKQCHTNDHAKEFITNLGEFL
jgi:hypothetical protein